MGELRGAAVQQVTANCGRAQWWQEGEGGNIGGGCDCDCDCDCVICDSDTRGGTVNSWSDVEGRGYGREGLQ